MEIRRLFLKIMLGSLALAAVFGVLGVLFASRTGMWRVMTSAFISAGAAALLIPVSMLVDRKSTRAAGLLGMALVVAVFVLSLSLTWELDRAVRFVSDEALALSIVSAVVTGLPAMFFLWLAGTTVGAVAGRVGAVLCALVFTLMLAALWLPRSMGWWTDDHVWETAAAVAGIGTLLVASLVGVGTGTPRWWRWVGVAAAAASLAMALWAIWMEIRSDNGSFATVTSAAAVLAHANLVLLGPRNARHRWLRWGTIAAAATAGTLVSVLALDFSFFGDIEEFIGRLVAAAAIAAGCGSLALLVLARLNRRVDFEPTLAPIVAMAIVCPRCRKKQSIDVGDARCAECDLRIRIRIEEPRCPTCGYALYRLESDRCPECGTRVREHVET